MSSKASSILLRSNRETCASVNGIKMHQLRSVDDLRFFFMVIGRYYVAVMMQQKTKIENLSSIIRRLNGQVYNLMYMSMSVITMSMQIDKITEKI